MHARNALSGIGLILFFLFSEPIPFGARMGDMPIHFTAHYFIPDGALGAPMILLLVPALVSLLVALLPLFRRQWNWLAFALLLPAAVFYALIWRSREPLGGWFPWLILALPFFGMNLWARSVDYFYASCIAAVFWDMGAAIRGIRLGLAAVPEPYGPHIPPLFSTVLDLSLAALFALLWRRRVDWGRRLGIPWIAALDENE